MLSDTGTYAVSLKIQPLLKCLWIRHDNVAQFLREKGAKLAMAGKNVGILMCKVKIKFQICCCHFQVKQPHYAGSK